MAGPVKQSEYTVEPPDQSQEYTVEAPADTSPPATAPPPQEKFGFGTEFENTLGRELTSAGQAMNPWGIAKGLYHNFTDPATSEEMKDYGANEVSGAKRVGLGVARTLGQPIDNAVGYYKNMMSSPATQSQGVEDMLSVAPEGIGAGAGTVLGGKLLETGIGAGKGLAQKIGQIKSPIAPIDPNAAVTDALHVPAKSPKMGAAIRDVEGSRPYLQGARTQAELQTRIPQAKTEIWKPYQDAIERLGEKQIKGPDGPTTASNLEAERLKLSAERQKVQKLKPTDRQGLLQQQSDAADLENRYKAVTSALDPELRSAGVDPEAVRNTHGNVKGVERNVSGKSTVTEATQPYGIRKMIPYGKASGLGMKIGWSPVEGINDMRQGQFWSGKPSDVGVRRVFGNSSGIAKPNLTVPIEPIPRPAPGEIPQLQRFPGGGGSVYDSDVMGTINRDLDRRFGRPNNYSGVERRSPAPVPPQMKQLGSGQSIEPSAGQAIQTPIESHGVTSTTPEGQVIERWHGEKPTIHQNIKEWVESNGASVRDVGNGEYEIDVPYRDGYTGKEYTKPERFRTLKEARDILNY